MDFDSAAVEHVVLYDFPRDPIEYMRRVGRTARAGRKGIVTVLAWVRSYTSSIPNYHSACQTVCVLYIVAHG
jgi:superfamily II DNA/RNA helicase